MPCVGRSHLTIFADLSETMTRSAIAYSTRLEAPHSPLGSATLSLWGAPVKSTLAMDADGLFPWNVRLGLENAMSKWMHEPFRMSLTQGFSLKVAALQIPVRTARILFGAPLRIAQESPCQS